MKKPKQENKEVFYSIKRKNSGYVIVNHLGEELSQEDMWVIAIYNLEKMLRKELGI